MGLLPFLYFILASTSSSTWYFLSMGSLRGPGSSCCLKSDVMNFDLDLGRGGGVGTHTQRMGFDLIEFYTRQTEFWPGFRYFAAVLPLRATAGAHFEYRIWNVVLELRSLPIGKFFSLLRALISPKGFRSQLLGGRCPLGGLSATLSFRLRLGGTDWVPGGKYLFAPYN